MEKIINPVSKDKILHELTPDKLLRLTNNGNREIYVIDCHCAPNTMLEIGRTREISFREAGGGTGKSVDIDEFDTDENPFKQLIVWDPIENEIVGGYRFKRGDEIRINADGSVHSPTAHLFEFTPKFINEYLPSTIELGRSFVQPEYQPTINIKKGIYSLDNVWDGLGGLVIKNPDVKYLYGKITMYPHFNKKAKDLIRVFLNKFFPDEEKLLIPHKAMDIKSEIAEYEKLFTGNSFNENYKILNQEARNLNVNVPPLVSAYINLSETMKTFGTAINDTFGDVEETGILLSIRDIYPSKIERHIATFHP